MNSSPTQAAGNEGEQFAPVEAQLTRFCGKCGSAISPTGVCPSCAQACPIGPSHDVASEIGQIKAALYLYFSLLAVSIVLLVVGIASPDRSETLGLEIAGGVGISLVTTVWAALRWNVVRSLLVALGEARWYVVAALGSVLTYIVASAAMGLLHRLLQVPSLDYLEPFAGLRWSFAWAVLLICVQPAIFEELAFRGVVQGSLEKALDKWQALFVTAAMFSILHLSPASMPHLLLLGSALGWLRLRSGSIYPGMVLHFLHNFWVIAVEAHGGLFT